MKLILISIGLIFFGQNCNGQILQGNLVIMPVEVYREQRAKTYLALGEVDSLKTEYRQAEIECDSIITLQDERIAGKDSIITNLNHKIELKDQEIALVSKKPKISLQSAVAFIIGAFGMALILK